MNRREFLQRLGLASLALPAAKTVVVFGSGVWSPGIPNGHLKAYDLVLREYYLEATREWLNCPRILSRLVLRFEGAGPGKLVIVDAPF